MFRIQQHPLSNQCFYSAKCTYSDPKLFPCWQFKPLLVHTISIVSSIFCILISSIVVFLFWCFLCIDIFPSPTTLSGIPSTTPSIIINLQQQIGDAYIVSPKSKTAVITEMILHKNIGNQVIFQCWPTQFLSTCNCHEEIKAKFHGTKIQKVILLHRKFLDV